MTSFIFFPAAARAGLISSDVGHEIASGIQRSVNMHGFNYTRAKPPYRRFVAKQALSFVRVFPVEGPGSREPSPLRSARGIAGLNLLKLSTEGAGAVVNADSGTISVQNDGSFS